MPTRDKARYLRPCLDSVLAAAEHARAEVIVVDNGSTDGTREILQSAYGDRLAVLDSPAPTVSGVRNSGAARAAGQYLCFVDCDCIVPPDYVDRTLTVFRETGAAAVGHKVAFPPNSWIERTWHNLHFVEETGPTRWLPGACFSVRADVFRTIGGFREDLTSGEDIELATRLIGAGHLVWAAPQLIIAHLDNPTTIAAFFRKEVWRGLGVDASGSLRRNKVLLITLLHAVLLVLALLVLMLAPMGWLPRVGLAAGLANVAPLASVMVRLRQARRRPPAVAGWRDVLPGLVLYHLYFLARGSAVVTVWWRRRRGRPAGE